MTGNGAGNGADDAVAQRWPLTAAGRASRERGRRTLVKLLDAAVAELTAYGYAGARVGRVAKRAGTSHGTFYVYFEDKDDLLVAIVQEIEGDMNSVLTAVPRFEPGPDGAAAVHQWVEQVCSVLQRHGPVLAAITDAMTSIDNPKVAAFALQNLGAWTTAMADRIRAARPEGVDPQVAALAVHAMVEAANRAVFIGDLLVGFDELVDGLSEFLYRSLFGADVD
jgi:AcrR family transcriptional regulator